MTVDLTTSAVSRSALEQRVVRYCDLRPCLNAFIDCRTPGSHDKENFTIIGPGVSENPDQYVHMEEPHGYNIGGARQPPNCVNSQHSHNTAEVFVVHTGRWRFDFGEHGTDASVEAAPGDVVSFPTNAFRGFTNIGEGPGFLWSVLGGDDPGRVTWVPEVFQLAQNYGLVLLETGALVDTLAGQTVPDGARPMRPTNADDVASLGRIGPDQIDRIIARDVDTRGREKLVIGQSGSLPPVDDFSLRRNDLAARDTIRDPALERQEVLFVHRGALAVIARDGEVVLGEGDTISIPPCAERHYRAMVPTTVFRVSAT